MGISDSVFHLAFHHLHHIIKNLYIDKADFGDSKPEITQLPNGIQIKIGPKRQPNNVKESKVRVINDEQRDRMTKLPRSQAKTEVRRMSHGVVYELLTPGVDTVEDIFVSKVESGYEVKALGKKKVYFNSLQINLPLRKYSIKDNKLTMEFGLEHNHFQ